MKKSLIPLFLIIFPVFIFAQTKEDLEVNVRSIKEDFKITSIDSSKHYYTINIALIILINYRLQKIKKENKFPNTTNTTINAKPACKWAGFFNIIALRMPKLKASTILAYILIFNMDFSRIP